MKLKGVRAEETKYLRPVDLAVWLDELSREGGDWFAPVFVEQRWFRRQATRMWVEFGGKDASTRDVVVGGDSSGSPGESKGTGKEESREEAVARIMGELTRVLGQK